jgi:hypothetical protein
MVETMAHIEYGAPAPATSPKKITRRRREEADAWLRVGAGLSAEIGMIADRPDLAVEVRMGGTRVGAAAAFYPDQALIEIGAKAFGKLDPETIEPDDPFDRERYLPAWGALTHEGAHAKHSIWTTPVTVRGSAVGDAAEMLEESRAEARLITARPGDTRYLQACVADLVMADFPTTLPDSPWAAAHAAGLIIARADAGILPRAMVWPVEREARRVLGRETYDELQRIWKRAATVGDEDTAGMLALAEAWCKALGVEGGEPAPGAGGEREGEGERPEDAGAPSPKGRVAAAVRRTTRKIAAKAAIEGPMIPASAKGEKKEHREKVLAIARRVFPAASPDEEPAGKRGRGPVSGSRIPAEPERAAAARLGRALRKAGVRERIETRTTSAAPPGRLSLRAAITRDAQRAAGAIPTAEPWSATSRRHAPNPPLKVGIAVDVSGSMAAATGPVASAAWILAHATRYAGPDNASATVAFGEQVTAITRPGKPPAQVPQFRAVCGTERVSEAIDALDGILDLTSPGTARLLVIVSDGGFVGYGEAEGARTRVARLNKAGCAVLWLDLFGGYSAVPPGATRVMLTNPAEAADAIGKAAITALAADR